MILTLGLIWWNWNSEERFSYFHEKAAELNFDRDQIIDFVRKDVAQESYAGSPRGALGALWGKAGNQQDRARLLKALLAETGLESKVIGDSSGCGVKLLENGEVIGVDKKPSNTWVPLEDKPDFTIRFSGANADTEFKGRVADFLRTPLRVSTGRTEARLLGEFGEVLWQGEFDPQVGFSMHLTFALGEKSSHAIWREFIPQGSDGSSRSEHVIVLAPCEIDQATYKKQAELVASDFLDTPGAVKAYELALSHWFQSDESLVDLKSFYKVDAWYKTPRVLIGSVYYAKDKTEPQGYAIDLRQNDIHIEADDKVKLPFALTRSSIEADLEARVIMEATGRRGRSSIDVMLTQLGEWAPSSTKRISDYQKTLAGFTRDTHPGSVLNLSAGEGLDISLTRLDGENAVSIKLSEALEARREEIPELPWTVIKSGKATTRQFAEFAEEIETLLGSASAVGFDYQPGVKLGHSPALVKSPHVRSFQYRYDKETKKSRVSFERQITQIRKDGSYSYEVKDYWDEMNSKWQRTGGRYNVPIETYQNGNGVSNRHVQRTISKGCNPFALGLKAYRELKNQGFTDVIAYLRDGSTTEPIRLYLIEEYNWRTTINQKPIILPSLRIGGRPVSENKGKQKWYDIELMDDPKTPYLDAFNRFYIFDDPQLPLVLGYGQSFQASVSGKVFAKGSNKPLGDAVIKVEQARISAKSWPTGDFVLPIIKIPFAEFKVTVSHPDYEPWSETLDFRVLENLQKLNKIQLTPRPLKNQFAWIEPESLDSGLAKIDNKRMARFVRQSLTDNPNLQALVPLKDVAFGAGSDRAWLLFNRSSGHITTVSSNGLHGADIGLPGDAARELQSGAVSAYSGYIASWYAYAGGKLNALTEAMGGGDFSDLGHAHAKAFALRFLERMMASTDNIFADQAGVNSDAYKAGFLKGLEFFDKNPEYRGE
ncbi:MAG: hypothetical protein AB8F34_10020 [Akkermansiaceae bacterium]